jgi:hypothetical protein
MTMKHDVRPLELVVETVGADERWEAAQCPGACSTAQPTTPLKADLECA